MDEFLATLLDVALGEELPDVLPQVAAKALVAGVDTPALHELAALRPFDPRVARELFIRAVHELGWEVPSDEAARWSRVRLWASAMLAGDMPPYQAARLIRWEAWEKLGRPDSLTPFVRLAAEWEDRADRRLRCERDMFAQARRIVQRGGST